MWRGLRSSVKPCHWGWKNHSYSKSLEISGKIGSPTDSCSILEVTWSQPWPGLQSAHLIWLQKEPYCKGLRCCLGHLAPFFLPSPCCKLSQPFLLTWKASSSKALWRKVLFLPPQVTDFEAISKISCPTQLPSTNLTLTELRQSVIFNLKH